MRSVPSTWTSSREKFLCTCQLLLPFCELAVAIPYSLGGVVPANEVDNDIGVSDGGLDRLGVAQVVFLVRFLATNFPQ